MIYILLTKNELNFDQKDADAMEHQCQATDMNFVQHLKLVAISQERLNTMLELNQHVLMMQQYLHYIDTLPEYR